MADLPSVFISHVVGDEELAIALSYLLESEEIAAIRASTLQPGSLVEQELRAAAESSYAIVVVLSEELLASKKGQRSELKRVSWLRSTGKRILLLANANTSNIPDSFTLFSPEVRLVESIQAAARELVEIRPATASSVDQPTFLFDGALSPHQVKGSLTALASYWRGCGGVGLPVEFETEEAVVREVINV